MSLGCLLVLEMAIVCANELYAIFLRELRQHLIDLLLQRVGLAIGMQRRIRDLVTLQLQVKIIAKQVVVPLHRLSRALYVAREYFLRYLASKAR